MGQGKEAFGSTRVREGTSESTRVRRFPLCGRTRITDFETIKILKIKRAEQYITLNFLIGRCEDGDQKIEQ